MRVGHLQSGPTQNCPPTLHIQPATHTQNGMKNRLYRTLMISYTSTNPQMTHSLVFSLLWSPLEGMAAWAGVAYHWNPSSVGQTSCVPRILSHIDTPNRLNNQRLGYTIKVKLTIIIILLKNPILFLGANSRNRACFALGHERIFSFMKRFKEKSLFIYELVFM